jgi:NADH-quinone oxidoreductase subunit E
MLSERGKATLSEILGRYPTRQAALLPALHLLQREHGFVSAEAEEWVAAELGLAPVKVHEVLTFYTMLRQERAGRHHLQVCRTLSCWLRGSGALLAHLRGRLGIGDGGQTGDGRFSLQAVECLGACGNAPVVQVNDDYHTDLTVEGLDRLLDRLE